MTSKKEPVRKVFISSVAKGLEAHRQAAREAFGSLPGWKPVRMEDFGPWNLSSIETCRQALADCDVLFGIIGELHGSRPRGESRSYTEIEYDLAVELSIPRLCVLSDPNPGEAMQRNATPFRRPRQSGNPTTEAAVAKQSKKCATRQQAFRKRVMAERQLGFYTTPSDVGRWALVGIQNLERDAPPSEIGDLESRMDITVLKFPHVTNQAGFDTGVSISNDSLSPVVTETKSGHVDLYYYGSRRDDNGIYCRAVETDSSSVIEAGEQLIFTLSGGNTDQAIRGLPDFQGYIIAVCHFTPASGFAMITDGFGGIPHIAAGYLAERIWPPISADHSKLKLPSVPPARTRGK